MPFAFMEQVCTGPERPHGGVQGFFARDESEAKPWTPQIHQIHPQLLVPTPCAAPPMQSATVTTNYRATDTAKEQRNATATVRPRTVGGNGRTAGDGSGNGHGGGNGYIYSYEREMSAPQIAGHQPRPHRLHRTEASLQCPSQCNIDIEAAHLWTKILFFGSFLLLPTLS